MRLGRWGKGISHDRAGAEEGGPGGFGARAGGWARAGWAVDYFPKVDRGGPKLS